MNLIIDIGNTQIKVALFEGNQLVKHFNYKDSNISGLNDILKKEKISQVIVSSTRSEIPEELKQILSGLKVIYFSSKTPIPIINKYKTPQSLGSDRLAGVIAAACKYPDLNVLVIDAGTCITFDHINELKEYEGGSISPGLEMRFKALHTFTGKLPLVSFDSADHYLLGEDTESAIRAGVQQGFLAEVTDRITEYELQKDIEKVLICGGDADFLITHLKNTIFEDLTHPEPFLVLEGLNYIINYSND